MSERAIIADRLRKKEQEVQALEQKLSTARVYVQALQDVLKLFESESDDRSAPSVLRAGSGVAQARDVIRAAGKPLHIDDLLTLMGKEASRDNRASLTSSLAAYVRRSEIFTRPAPNTYGLEELGGDLDEEPVGEPPAGFGDTAPRASATDLDDEIPF